MKKNKIIPCDISKLLKGKVHIIHRIRLKLLKGFPPELRKELEKTWGTIKEIREFIVQEEKRL